MLLQTPTLRIIASQLYLLHAGTTHMDQPTNPDVTMEKPIDDDCLYRYVMLENKLEVMLTHDPNTNKASAALTVNTGSFSDLKDKPGVTHGIEHMLSMRTENTRTRTISTST
jgi:secreted Zn-dependent insulinase-like peptidase